MDEDGIRYRRFHVLGENRRDTGGSVTAAIYYNGPEMGDHVYSVQFSYSSPRERNTDKKFGQTLAKLRLMSDDPERGRILMILPEKRVGLTELIKETIIDEARRKRIRWLANTTMDQIV